MGSDSLETDGLLEEFDPLSELPEEHAVRARPMVTAIADRRTTRVVDTVQARHGRRMPAVSVQSDQRLAACCRI